MARILVFLLITAPTLSHADPRDYLPQFLDNFLTQKRFLSIPSTSLPIPPCPAGLISFKIPEKQKDLLNQIEKELLVLNLLNRDVGFEDTKRMKIADYARRRAPGTTGKCYAAVKRALLNAGGYEYNHSARYARNAARELSEYGFVNLMDYGLDSTSGELPIGTILVYHRVNANGDNNTSHPGHIEIVTSGLNSGAEKGYCSDFCSPDPIENRSYGENYRLTGILVHAEESDRERLQDLQEIGEN